MSVDIRVRSRRIGSDDSFSIAVRSSTVCSIDKYGRIDTVHLLSCSSVGWPLESDHNNGYVLRRLVDTPTNGDIYCCPVPWRYRRILLAETGVG